MTTTFPSTDFVTLAALDQDSSQIHLLIVPKTVYLVKGAEMTLTSSLGATLQLRATVSYEGRILTTTLAVRP